MCIGNLQMQGTNMSRDARETVFGVFDQVQNKPGCTATEDG